MLVIDTEVAVLRILNKCFSIAKTHTRDKNPFVELAIPSQNLLHLISMQKIPYMDGALTI